MRSLLILLLFGCLLIHVIGRPQKPDYNTDSDAEEREGDEDSDSSADSYSEEYEDSRLNDHGLEAKADENQELRKDNPSLSNLEEDLKAYPKRHKLAKLTQNDADDEQQEIQQRVIHHDVNKFSHDDNENERSQGNKGGVDLEAISSDDDRDMFEKNRQLVSYINKQEYNTNDESVQPRYYKQYYNTMQAENKDLGEHKAREGPRLKFRNRRDIKEGFQLDNSFMSDKDAKYSNGKTDNEDEESAIKRHIKKLSKGELDHLLTSLPEEKRYILKKIIADTDLNYNGFINKREITKKAGAVEENNINENCQSDLGTVHGDSAAVEISTNAPSEVSDSGSSKLDSISPENLETTQRLVDSVTSSSTVELSNSELGQKNDDGNINTLALSLDSKIPAEIIDNVQITSKAENKREAHLGDLEETDDSLEDKEQDYLNDQRYLSSQDEKGPSGFDDSNQQYEDKNYKREAYYDKQPELSESLKSLEESFPNNYAYDDSGPYSGPLIRVKRKNPDQMVKKLRAARRVSDSKVAYVPYKAENEDEDNDEGNESDDEGFYDRTSYFANSNKAVEVEEDTTKTSEYSVQANEADNAKSSNMDSDTMSLGSDTDSVLSGVEGVDDNLMFNGGVRSRRTANENASEVTQSEADISTQLVLDEIKAPVGNLMNLPLYQENVAFGPLPRNYDGDLARYKRVRRVKQQQNLQEPNSSKT